MNNNYNLSETDIDKLFKYLLKICIFRCLSLSFPLIILDVTYDTKFPLYLLSGIAFLSILIHSETFVLLFELLYNIVIRPSLYIWSFAIIIQGKQDFIAIAFYIFFAVQFLNILKKFLHSTLTLLNAFKNH